MLKSGKTNVAKEKIYGAEKTIIIWDVCVNNIVISCLIEMKNSCKYLIRYLDEVIRPLVLILPKTKRWVDMLKHLKRKIKKWFLHA